ncbi:MAG: FG-GAP-like repeat-containing protein [Candidatus Electryonea clarkiae]|nr:FG-GAP-like repeat-containing protein [Candidatus Electryonea clarkiae]MDP8285025.1 FG-GAP-like repeat-containing protein [Candidatus Electryonea clarkiae]
MMNRTHCLYMIIVMFLLFVNPISAQLEFTRHDIDNPNGPLDICAGDIDGDGDIDIAAALFYGNALVWWENNGIGVITECHNVALNDSNVRGVALADLDEDGDTDCSTSTIISLQRQLEFPFLFCLFMQFSPWGELHIC